MKNLLFLLSVASLTLLSCDKDDDCTPGTLESVIVGTWNVQFDGDQLGEVQFLEDGTFIDNAEALVFNPTDADMSYFVDSETTMRIRVEIGAPVDFTVQVADFSCDEVNISITNLDKELRRK